MFNFILVAVVIVGLAGIFSSVITWFHLPRWQRLESGWIGFLLYGALWFVLSVMIGLLLGVTSYILATVVQTLLR